MHPTARYEWRAAGWGVLGLVAVLLFGAAAVVDLRCELGNCTGPTVRRLLDLDAVDGLPRLFTTAVLAGAGVLALRAAPTAPGRVRLWWAAVATVALGLAVLKATSAHALVEGGTSPWTTLLVGAGVAVPALVVLAGTGRAWGVPAAVPVVVAFTGCALAALGLDLVTTAVEALQDHAGAVSRWSATLVEEFGEAVAALAVLAVVRSRTAGRS